MKIVCICNKGIENSFSIGKEYTVLHIVRAGYIIYDNNGDDVFVLSKRFNIIAE